MSAARKSSVFLDRSNMMSTQTILFTRLGEKVVLVLTPTEIYSNHNQVSPL